MSAYGRSKDAKTMGWLRGNTISLARLLPSFISRHALLIPDKAGSVVNQSNWPKVAVRNAGVS
jgi:hypothetical protein